MNRFYAAGARRCEMYLVRISGAYGLLCGNCGRRVVAGEDA